MADGISEAERTQHGIGRGTRNAIIWTGTVQALIALATLLWTAWWAMKVKGEEKRTKKKEDDEDKKRRKVADEEDKRRLEELDRVLGERVAALLRSVSFV